MKVIGVLFLVVAVASAKVTYKLPQAIVDKIYQTARPCADEYNVDHSLIARVADGTLPRDEATNKFLYCFILNADYINKDAKINIAKLQEFAKGHPLEVEFVESLKKCDQIVKEDVISTAAAKNACFADVPPIRFLL